MKIKRRTFRAAISKKFMGYIEILADGGESWLVSYQDKKIANYAIKYVKKNGIMPNEEGIEKISSLANGR